MAIQKFNVIKSESIISIEVSGAFYKRIYSILTAALDREENPKQSLINIDTPEQELTINEALIQSLMVIINSVETEANKNLDDYTEVIEKEIVTDDPSES